MNKIIRWKVTAVVIVAIWGAMYLLPNFWDTQKYSFLPKSKIVYGLDIQGGLHLVMGVDVAGVVTESLRRTGSSIQGYLKEKNLEVTSTSLEKTGDVNELVLELKNESDKERALKEIEDFYKNLQIVKTEGSKIYATFLDTYVRETKKFTVEQSIETLRNRIDEMGVAEPSITAQGDDRILIQLPGIKDAQQAKELINKTAKLEFLLVAKDVDMAKISDEIQKAEAKGSYSLDNLKYSEYIKRINADLAGVLPKNTLLLFEKQQNAETMNAAKIPHVLELGLNLGGEDLKSANTNFGQFGEPEVSLQFTASGATKFGDITGANVGRQMAVILDDVVYTAPNIKDRIGGGNAVITLGRGSNYDAQLKEANLISMALRAGALPAKLEQLEERTVGPTLGADSIDAAKKAVMYGMIFISLFMIFYYKTMGLISIVALGMNGILMVATLSSINATLTLPGIAGIGLTMGMAIDANVIIYERIREELKRGLDIVAACREGFNRAFSAILDANLTTAATSAILMYYGTGPVRGFGLTLLIGIVTTMFTAVFLTQTIAEFLIFKMNIRKIRV